ncbi:septal ring lytic transglycosylase RlpA family protein [Pontixanthobacter luteolus]|uniref:septal ring lytic transglycosylase RlpA family protein n=1 Tax=Pontixanthobacter luteolus TaxID=295089 RepID=UPI0023021666|nr:septal ring lytic transglycosylase RlpA family protein [Pontixanthobacter luteolus]
MQRVLTKKSAAGRFIAASLVTALAVCGSLGGPAMADPGFSPVSDEIFEDRFARFEDLPPAPDPSGNVVDLTQIDPPLEIEEAKDARSLGSGVASYYGRRFHGRKTANGERFNMNALTAAHRTLPFGTEVRVTNPRNGKSVTVRINDRGPFARSRTIDLSRAAATEIGLIKRGHGTVELEVLNP